MEKYDDYTYARTLRFFEAYYPYDVEDVHYDEVMLSMSQCKDIDELIAVRERIKDKVEKVDLSAFIILPDDVFKEISSCRKRDPAVQAYTNMIKTLKDDINTCYDENIVRLFKERKEITAEFCGECFVNLSSCNEGSKYKEQIIHEASEKSGIDVSDILDSIALRYKDFKEHWDQFKKYREGMNGYKPAKLVVEEDFAYLKKFNYRLLPREKALYGIIDREEKKIIAKDTITKDNFLDERRKYWRRIREDEEKGLRRIEIKKHKVKDPDSLSTGQIVILVIVGLLIGALFASPLGPWLFALIVIFFLFSWGLK